MSDLPRIKYQQTADDALCLVYSLASALHYIGLTNLGSQIYNLKGKIGGQADSWDRLRRLIVTRWPLMQPTLLKKGQIDLLKNLDQEVIYVVALEDGDGATDHVVTVVRGMIFDCNLQHALLVSQKSLDICCSTEQNIIRCESIYVGLKMFMRWKGKSVLKKKDLY